MTRLGDPTGTTATLDERSASGAEPLASAVLSRRSTLLLLLVSALALILRLGVAKYLPIDHNGAWHLFIARNFRREYANLAHPPLFLLLLKACDAVSHSLPAFRFFPVLAGVGSVFLVGRILTKLGTLSSVALLGALTLACAPSAIVLSVEVESYTLCVFLLLASLLYYLDIAQAEAHPRARVRILFAGLACLALLSHYFAGLYLAACLLAPVAAAVIRPTYRRALGNAMRRRWAADLLTFLPPAVVGAALYHFLAKPWARSLDSFPLFYFRPGEETVTSFWIRNLRETFNLFAPVSLPRARQALPVLAIFLGMVIWAPASEKRGAATSANRILPSLFLAVLLLLCMVLGVLGRYPFGGEMRHQFLLFVFALIAGCVALDRLLRALPPAGRHGVVVVCLAAVGANVMARRREVIVPPYRSQALVAKRGIFQRSLANVRTVHIDQFNLIGMVMDYYGWAWRFAGRNPANPSIERYELTNGREKFTVVAHRGRWIMDFRDGALYSELRSSFEAGGDACETVFCVNRNVYAPPWVPLADSEREELLARIPSLAAAAELATSKLVLSDDTIYADFCVASKRVRN